MVTSLASGLVTTSVCWSAWAASFSSPWRRLHAGKERQHTATTTTGIGETFIVVICPRASCYWCPSWVNTTPGRYLFDGARRSTVSTAIPGGVNTGLVGSSDPAGLRWGPDDIRPAGG